MEKNYSLSLSQNSKLKLFSNKTYSRMIMVIFCAGFFVFGFGGKALAATYYIAKVNGSLKYLSGAIPDAGTGIISSPNDINQLLFDIGDNNTVVFTSGTYSGTELDATDGVDIGRIQTIRTMIPTDPEYGTYGGPVVWDCAGLSDNCVTTSVNVTLQGPDFTIRGADSTKYGVYSSGNALTF